MTMHHKLSHIPAYGLKAFEWPVWNVCKDWGKWRRGWTTVEIPVEKTGVWHGGGTLIMILDLYEQAVDSSPGLLSPSSTIWYHSEVSDALWLERGNRKSSFAQAMHHRQ